MPFNWFAFCCVCAGIRDAVDLGPISRVCSIVRLPERKLPTTYETTNADQPRLLIELEFGCNPCEIQGKIREAAVAKLQIVLR